jgi:hypothetical protein
VIAITQQSINAQIITDTASVFCQRPTSLPAARCAVPRTMCGPIEAKKRGT